MLQLITLEFELQNILKKLQNKTFLLVLTRIYINVDNEMKQVEVRLG